MLDTLYMQVLDMSKVASIVILAVMLARLVLKKAPKWISYALWAVVLVRLLCPVSIEAPLSIVPEVTSVSEGYTLADEPVSFAGAGEAAYQAVGDVLNGGLGIQHIRTTERDETGMTRYVSTDWWSVWILFGQYVWVFGMLTMAVYSVVSYGKLRCRLQVVAPLRENIFVADDIQSPFVIGFWKPKIYLPCGLGETEREYIILHEQHHIRRFDHIVKALAFLALTVHWFNPLVWAAFVLACKDMEMSCDEAVVSKMGEDIRADYSASLLTFATGRRIIAGTPLAFGEGDTRGRIKNLANWKKPAFWVVIAAVILCVALAVCLLTDPLGAENEIGNEVQEDFVGKVVDINDTLCLVKVTDSGSSDLVAGNNVIVNTDFEGSPEFSVGDYIRVFFNGVVEKTPQISMAVARIPRVFSIEKMDQNTETEDPSDIAAETPAETVQRIVNSIFVGALSYDESWQSNGNYTLTVTTDADHSDTYVCVPYYCSSLDSTPGYYLATRYTWSQREEAGEDAQDGYSMRFANERYSFTVYSNSGRIVLTENETAMVFYGLYFDPNYRDDMTGFSAMFKFFCNDALSAEAQRALQACVVSGEETDYTVIAQKMTEQYAQAVADHPAWYHQKALDVIPGEFEVFDAYYGEDAPNFCFGMGLHLKIDPKMRNYWEVGSGLINSASYPGYYEWGREACVRKGEDGNWHLYAFNTGGSSAWLPVAPEEASARQLMELYFLTDGFTHNYLLIYYLAEKPLDEVHAELNALPDDQREEMKAAILRFLEEYPDYTTWTVGDFA